MLPTLLNVGSLNIDEVYRVPRIVRPGETRTSTGREVHAGGKGANQSVAAARAGRTVEHVGLVGADGVWLRELLEREGVGVGHVGVDPDTPTGHAVIQVDDAGENAIFLFAGANHGITANQLDAALDAAGPGDWVLTQNETGNAAAVLAAAAARGLRIAFNPAPMTAAVREIPLDRVELLVVNQQEAADLLGRPDAEGAAEELGRRVRGLAVVTRGAAGARAGDGGASWRVPAAPVQRVVDTTAAGDTFTGYLVAGLMDAQPVERALQHAAAAAAAAVGRAGAIASIPTAAELGA